jgi:hypothetical protein
LGALLLLRYRTISAHTAARAKVLTYPYYLGGFCYLEPTILRRFAFKVAFQPLTEEGRLVLFERYFPKTELYAEAGKRLARLNTLTPGDFKAVLSRTRLLYCLSANDLVAELEAEVSYKNSNSPIGFHE